MAVITALAGVNGAGKSSVAGEYLRKVGSEYYNPDEVARSLLEETPALSPIEANSQAWRRGRTLLLEAIETDVDFVFETTLGGATISRHLRDAAAHGHKVSIWYVGLASPELHIARVAARVAKGGHDIPEDVIRRRYDRSRSNLVALIPVLEELLVFDNSREANPEQEIPSPRRLLHMKGGRVLAQSPLSPHEFWAKPVLAAAMEHALGVQARRPGAG